MEMLKLLRVCAHARREGYDFLLRPSRKVDLAWHAFILHTRDYADNCRSELDFFVHHAPEAPPNGNGADVQGMFDYAPVP